MEVGSGGKGYRRSHIWDKFTPMVLRLDCNYCQEVEDYWNIAVGDKCRSPKLIPCFNNAFTQATATASGQQNSVPSTSERFLMGNALEELTDVVKVRGTAVE